MRRESLAHNTVMLYILTVSSYLFSFITLPYLTRVLGAEVYGRIGFGTAFASYVQLFVSFGFILSGTAKIAECSNDNEKMSDVYSCVTYAKMLLVVVCLVVFIPLCVFVDQFSADPVFYLMYLLYAAANALIPDFVYRGVEKMTMVTIGTLTIKTVFLIGVFIFVKDSSSYVLVPALYAAGAIIADTVMAIHLAVTMDVKLRVVSFAEIWMHMKDSAQFFLSRAATTFYTSMNTLVLGFVIPGTKELGHFTACNNLVHAGKSLSSPIADSLYPFMLRTKNYNILLKILGVGEMILIPACIVFGIFAPDICEWFFGEGFRAAGNLMRVLVLLIPISLASYLMGFPALSPMGKTATANSSVVVGALLQVILLSVLFFLNQITPLSVSVASVFSELSVLVVRVYAFLYGYHNSRTQKA